MDAIPPYHIFEFNLENLAEALSNKFTSPGEIKKKRQFKYLSRYLSHLHAKTIVVENRYVSKDFLDDYTAYYALCFEKYEKECKRVHIFSESFDEGLFREIISQTANTVSSDFWTEYLGNIVVKPIPITVIGTTILKTYPHYGEFGGRNYWGLKDYTVHVFGTKVTIRSLVFQEQDHVLAACATTAIWSTLNKVSHGHQTSIKSPSQITKEAAETSNDGSRLFPNKGLDVLQICHALQRSGLVCDVRSSLSMREAKEGKTFSNAELRQLVRAYSPIGIPIILIVRVPAMKRPSSAYDPLHAITLVGHRHNGPLETDDEEIFRPMSDNIDRLYAHDDQFGPFVRIRFGEGDTLLTPWNELSISGEETFTISEPTEEQRLADQEEAKVFVQEDTTLPVSVFVTDVVLGLYPKIRITYDDIQKLTLGIRGFLRNFTKEKYPKGLCWDIRLLYSEDYKQEIKQLVFSKDDLYKVLTRSLPKFVWVVSCYADKQRIADFSFDATGVSSAMNGIHVLTFVDDMKEKLHSFMNDNWDIFEDYYSYPNATMYFEWLVANTK